jgi:ABC-type transporter lipoprotein component MlaA
MKTNPIPYLEDVSTRNTLLALSLIDKRAGFLAADKVVEAAALDKYSYIRDAHLQRRRSLIYDGNPPREGDDSASTTEVDIDRDGTLAYHANVPAISREDAIATSK